MGAQFGSLHLPALPGGLQFDLEHTPRGRVEAAGMSLSESCRGKTSR